MLRRAGLHQAGMRRVGDGSSTAPAQYFNSFEDETLFIMRTLVPGAGFDRRVGTDLVNPNDFGVSPAGALANPPAQVTNTDGGVYSLNNAGIFLNNKLPLLAHPRGACWGVRTLVKINAAIFTAAGGATPISLSSTAGGGTDFIQMLPNATTTQMGLYLQKASTPAGNSGVLSLGADGVLGGSLFPVNHPVPITLWYDLQAIRWMFFDTYNPANVLTQAQMDFMPDVPMVVGVQNTDATIGAAFTVDAIACVWVSSPF